MKQKKLSKYEALADEIVAASREMMIQPRERPRKSRLRKRLDGEVTRVTIRQATELLRARARNGKNNEA